MLLLLSSLLALTIQFDPTEYTGDEGKDVSVTAVLNRPADRVITVTLMTEDDSAIGRFAPHAAKKVQLSQKYLPWIDE